MNDDFGGFLVSVSVLDKKAHVKYIIKEDVSIPFANGWYIYSDIDDEFELVTIHTLKDCFPEIDEFLNMSTNNNFEIKYENDIYCGYKVLE